MSVKNRNHEKIVDDILKLHQNSHLLEELLFTDLLENRPQGQLSKTIPKDNKIRVKLLAFFTQTDNLFKRFYSEIKPDHIFNEKDIEEIKQDIFRKAANSFISKIEHKVANISSEKNRKLGLEGFKSKVKNFISTYEIENDAYTQIASSVIDKKKNENIQAQLGLSFFDRHQDLLIKTTSVFSLSGSVGGASAGFMLGGPIGLGIGFVVGFLVGAFTGLVVAGLGGYYNDFQSRIFANKKTVPQDVKNDFNKQSSIQFQLTTKKTNAKLAEPKQRMVDNLTDKNEKRVKSNSEKSIANNPAAMFPARQQENSRALIGKKNLSVDYRKFFPM